MAESLVVTDGTDSFYESRGVFQTLFDFGDYDRITALSSSVVDAKKMLLSRQARYSGLVDILQFSEAPLAEGMADANVWVAVNAKPSEIDAQVEAAKAAGVKRAFVMLSSAGPEDADLNIPALESTLAGSGMEYTIMRTGTLSNDGSGSGLKLDQADLPVCEDVNKDDIYRFVTESLTLPSANGRSFSICPSADDTQLKAMRMAGCTRREEVEALLKGQILEKTAEEVAAEALPTPEQEEEASQSQAEEAASREEELKMLMQRAKERGIEQQKRMAEEEKEKAAKREERNLYFNSQGGDENKDDDSTEEPPAAEKDDKPSDDKKPDDDDDGLVAA